MRVTLLPWMDTASAGHILTVTILFPVFYQIFEYIFRRYNLTMRRGTLAIIGNTVWPFFLNICFYALFYWYWALPLSVAFTLVFFAVIRGELKAAYEDERLGGWGVSKEIRKLRADAFGALSLEEQMAYKEDVRPQKFLWQLYFPALIVIPFLIVMLLSCLGVGEYLFVPVVLEP